MVAEAKREAKPAFSLWGMLLGMASLTMGAVVQWGLAGAATALGVCLLFAVLVEGLHKQHRERG